MEYNNLNMTKTLCMIYISCNIFIEQKYASNFNLILKDLYVLPKPIIKYYYFSSFRIIKIFNTVNYILIIPNENIKNLN